MSETARGALSIEMAQKCRLIDRVKLRGSKVALNIHALDLDYMNLPLEDPPRQIIWNSRARFRARQFLELEKRQKLEGEGSTMQYWTGCADTRKMREPFKVEFFEVFKM